jgi:hypothetical protein
VCLCVVCVVRGGVFVCIVCKCGSVLVCVCCVCLCECLLCLGVCVYVCMVHNTEKHFELFLLSTVYHTGESYNLWRSATNYYIYFSVIYIFVWINNFA